MKKDLFGKMIVRQLSFGLFIMMLAVFSLASCDKESSYSGPKLFTRMDATQTGIDFANNLTYNREFNIYTYRNFYNGGGVSIGDVNNDGLMDIYLTANMESNRLYLNKGNFEFIDVTEQAGVGGEKAWSTGAVMADVNGDGWLDIYVCNSGDIEGDNKENELFINQGSTNNLGEALPGVAFEEEATKYGLADKGYGTHAAFFDYDKDGDLDVYLLNNSYRSIFDFNQKKDQRPIRDSLGGDKFFRNDLVAEGGQAGSGFVDVSEQVGIYGSEIGFGLGITLGDVNRDGWIDMFVSNDFFERDYLYVNNGDGTFKEDLENQILSLSVASMGADMADLNHDGYPELFVTEMLPEQDDRYKTKMTFENWDRYQSNLRNGYYHQFTRNVLQLNNADSSFSEIGRLADIEATDWSWGALLADYDNDGEPDLYVANGLYQDIIDQDYINFVSSEEVARQVITKEGVNFKKLIDTIPSTPISNYMFQNKGDVTFENVAQDWGLAIPSHSNGAAYGDLDNDGDLDLIVNNVNAPAFVFKNETRQVYPDRNYLKVELIGESANTQAIGANVELRAAKQTFYLEKIGVRGFQSNVDDRLNFGLGTIDLVDTLVVNWPNAKQTLLTNVAVNQTLRLQQRDADQQAVDFSKPSAAPVFTEVTDDLAWGYRHRENQFVDFDRDRLIYHMISNEGPKVAVGDVNGDGLEDIFVGGAAQSSAVMLVQQSDGTFQRSNEAVLNFDRYGEDTDCIFFDADGDEDLDLYVARGGNEFLGSSQVLVDQLFFNDGVGNFSRSPQFLPTLKPESSSCVRAADFDNDGDQDLLVGIRIIPGYYGLNANAYLLANDGKGKFTNVTKEVVPELDRIGMVTDVYWLDYDADEDLDFVVVGEWMPITVFENKDGEFRIDRSALSDPKTNGWWNCIRPGDFDNDGDIDLIVGNHGLNSRFRASKEKPISIYINDFDDNGTPEQLITQYNGDESYPLVLRHDLVMQLPKLKKKYLKYHDFKEQTVDDIFTDEERKGTVVKEVYQLESSILLNQGDGRFEVKALPLEAQYAPAFGLLVEDVDRDGNLDVLVGGNQYRVKPEVGRYDANYGLWLKGNGDGTFQAVKSKASGMNLKGEVRDFEVIEINGKRHLLVAKNNDIMQVFTY